MSTASEAYKIVLLRKLQETLQNMPPEMQGADHYYSSGEPMFVPGENGKLNEIQWIGVLGSSQSDREAGLQITYSMNQDKVPESFNPDKDLRPLPLLLLQIAQKSNLRVVPQFDRNEPVKEGTCVMVEPEQSGLRSGRFCMSFHKDDIPTLLQTVNSMLSEQRQSFRGSQAEGEIER